MSTMCDPTNASSDYQGARTGTRGGHGPAPSFALTVPLPHALSIESSCYIVQNDSFAQTTPAVDFLLPSQIDICLNCLYGRKAEVCDCKLTWSNVERVYHDKQSMDQASGLSGQTEWDRNYSLVSPATQSPFTCSATAYTPSLETASTALTEPMSAYFSPPVSLGSTRLELDCGIPDMQQGFGEQLLDFGVPDVQEFPNRDLPLFGLRHGLRHIVPAPAPAQSPLQVVNEPLPSTTGQSQLLSTSGQQRQPSALAAKRPPYPPKRFRCPHLPCPWSFNHKRDFNVHVGSLHVPQYYNCPITGCTSRIRGKKSNIKRHVQKVHGAESPSAKRGPIKGKPWTRERREAEERRKAGIGLNV